MPIRVRILYFAALRDLVGHSEEWMDLPEPALIEDVSRAIALEHPELRARLPSARFAINEAFAAPGERLRPGDAVAVIPPVSGG